MTNAEKYIGDEDTIHEFIDELAVHIIERLDGSFDDDKDYIVEVLKDFFKKNVKPTLTEDERVILRNIAKRYKLICKDNAYNLFVKNGTYDLEKINPLNNLFQFIKERRRILNRRTFERRIKWILQK